MKQVLRGKRRWTAVGAAGVLAAAFTIPAAISFADSPGGCDFSPANNGTASCSSPLSGSTFAGGDGNLATSPTTFGTTDWQNVSVVTGSIPPNKSDLTRFYESNETASNNHVYLYLGWERTNVLGSANMDFEINHSSTAGFTGSTTGPVTLNRTAGDLLVTYDFTNGGGVPTIGLLRWLTTAAGNTVSQCFSANALPCWGNRVDLSAANEAIAAVNNLDTVNDPITNVSLSPNTFGEAAIDLTAAGVFGANTCTGFGSAFLKSRSSASFTAEVKDFIAPVPINISNCGTITVIKHTSPRGLNQSFGYTTTGGLTPSTFNLNDNGCAAVNSCTGNTKTYSDVPAGPYSVTEGADPTGFAFNNVSCTTNGAASPPASVTISGRQASINLGPNDNVVCTYVNDQQLGAIKVTKTSVKGTALDGATFSVTGPNSYSHTLTSSGTDGSDCVDGLVFGTYHVTETAAPTGYHIDDSTTHDVTVGTNTSCSGTPSVTLPFTDTPLTDVTASATSEASGGTQSRITCIDSANHNVGDSPKPSSSTFGDPVTVTANGLAPGTYVCTVVIDP